MNSTNPPPPIPPAYHSFTLKRREKYNLPPENVGIGEFFPVGKSHKNEIDTKSVYKI